MINGERRNPSYTPTCLFYGCCFLCRFDFSSNTAAVTTTANYSQGTHKRLSTFPDRMSQTLLLFACVALFFGDASAAVGMQFYGLTTIQTAGASYHSVSNGFAFFATTFYPLRVDKYSLPAYTRVGGYTHNTVVTVDSICGDDSHIYFGLGTNAGTTATVLKVQLSDLTLVGSYTFSSVGRRVIKCLTRGDGFGFFVFRDDEPSPDVHTLRKVELSTMKLVATSSSYPLGGSSGSCAMIDSTGTFGYFSGSAPGTTLPHFFHKIRLNDMSPVRKAPSPDDAYVCIMHPTDDAVGYFSNRGALERWDLDSMAQLSSVAMATVSLSAAILAGDYFYIRSSAGQSEARIHMVAALTGQLAASTSAPTQYGSYLFPIGDVMGYLDIGSQSMMMYGFCDPASRMFNGTSCTRCPVGYVGCGAMPPAYCSSCVPCGPGTYASADGTTCTLCAAGTFAAGAASSSCEACAGSTLRGASTCNSLGCPRGTFVAGNGTCLPCAAGEYSSTAGSVACAACPSGTSSTVVGANSSASCVPCTAGTFSDAGSVECTPCPAGTFSTRAGATSSAFCLFCAAGSWNAVPGSSTPDSCTPCAAGTYSAVVAAVSISTCSPCEAGTYSTKAGASAAHDCTACPAGTFGNSSGAASGAACATCPAGSYSLAGATICTTCDEGTYGPRPGAKSEATCVACPPGTYQPAKGASSLAMCTPCGAGTYNSGFGASSEADCTQCPIGSFSSRTGSPSPTACELCPSGTYGPTLGATSCTPCPEGTYSAAAGASDPGVCLPCAPGTYSNATLAVARGGSVAACAACPPGHFQNTTGSPRCLACPSGSFNEHAGATNCDPCGQGTYCADGGCVACRQCPPGSYQPARGADGCVACSRELTYLPEAVSSPRSAQHVVSVCSPLQHSFSINWGPIADPSILHAETVVSVAGGGNGTAHDWLTVAVLQSTVVVVTAAVVPSALSANQVVLGVRVTQTCRAAPWTSLFTLVLLQVHPSFSLAAASAFDFDTAGAASVKACPDFEFRFSVSVGSCPDKTVIKAMLSSPADPTNLTAVPEYVRYTYDQGTLAVYGTVPTEFAAVPLMIVATAFLDGARYVSAETVSVVRHEVESAPTFAALDATQVAACPYVRVVFTAVPAACGLTIFSAALQGGVPLPSFLAAHVSNAQVIVSGVVPQGTPPFVLHATATVVGALSQANYSSAAVTVARPASVNPLAVSVDILSDDSAAQQQLVINGTRTVSVIARYGIAVRLALHLVDPSGSSGSGFQCTSQALLVGTSDGQPPTGANDVTGVPSWLPAVSLTPSSIIFAGMPGQSVTGGERSEFFVSAFDGVRNPVVRVHVTVVPSLTASVRQSNASNSTALVLSVATPSPIVSVSAQLSVTATADAQLVFVCPPAGAASAVCSFDSVSGSLGAFGTVDGINKVLLGLRLAVSSTSSQNARPFAANGDVAFVLSDSVNPSPIVVTLPTSQLAAYDGVRLASPIALQATVGKPLAAPLASHFTMPPGDAIFELSASPAPWVAVSAAGLLTGLPQGPAGVVSGALVVRDAYVRQTVAFDINVSMPRPPALVLPHKPVPLILAESSIVSDVALDASVFVDPENGTLQFQLRLSSSSSAVLPAFIVFDAATLHVSLSPSVTDVGSYTLELLALSEFSSPQWHGNASLPVPVRVDLSWRDFFQQMYEIAGYVTFVLSAVGIPWVFRAHLRNTVCFRRYHLPAAPPSFLGSKSFTVSDTHGRPIPAADIAAVSIHPLALVRSKQRPGVVRSCIVPRYIDRLLRREANPYHTVANVGVPWAAQAFSGGTRVVHVDSAALARLVQRGEVRASQQFLLEATYASWVRQDMVAVSFEFTASDMLTEGTADGDDDRCTTDGNNALLLEEEEAWASEDLLNIVGDATVATVNSHPQETVQLDRDRIASLEAEVCSLRLLLGHLQGQQQRHTASRGNFDDHEAGREDPYHHAFRGTRSSRRAGTVSPSLALASVFGED